MAFVIANVFKKLWNDALKPKLRRKHKGVSTFAVSNRDVVAAQSTMTATCPAFCKRCVDHELGGYVYRTVLP